MFSMSLRGLALLFLCLVLAPTLATARDTSLQPANPEAAGFSREGLKRLEDGMKAYVDDKQVAGVVTLLARHGHIVQETAAGVQDLTTGAPMRTNTIMRIASMTKPITGVAMMILYEEGKWQPSDPVSLHIPEFKNLKVLAGKDKNGKPILVAPEHEPTMSELMSHTAGFAMFPQDEEKSEVDRMYAEAKPFSAPNLQGFIDVLATMPLDYQPGTRWKYSVSVDIQGYLVEKLSGQPFGAFLRERIFKPLRMADTGFSVPPEKLSRVATLYIARPSGLEPQPHRATIHTGSSVLSGGGGLYSTAADYLRFAQMLAHDGLLEKARILKADSIKLMRTNVLSDAARSPKPTDNNMPQAGLGFGFDFAIVEAPEKIGSPVGKGTYYWIGAFGTWFWIDPVNDLIFVGMIQRVPSPRPKRMDDTSRALVYRALTKPEK